MADNFLESLFDPKELYDVLKGQNLLPKWAPTLPYSGASGEYYPRSNRLVANYPDNPGRKNVMAHEMSHAVQTNLMDEMGLHIADRKWKKEKVSPEEEQFLRAMEQLRAVQFGRVGQYNRQNAEVDRDSLTNLMDKLYKPRYKDDKEYNSYRRHPKEAQSFGIGAMSEGASPNVDYPGQHLDPTMATEFALLLDMYNRLPQPLRDGAAARRKESIQKYRELEAEKSVEKDFAFLPHVDYRNPFLPPIEVPKTPKRK